MIATAAWRSMRAASKAAIAKDAELHISGADQLPAAGPVLLVARHYHHLYDGAAILATIPREVRVLVGLDWVERPAALLGMQKACRAAGWPVVYRDPGDRPRSMWLPALRSALRESVALLADGKILLVFPEGYPTIDPHGSKKSSDDEFLPFQPGFARIAIDSWRQGIETRIVPLGFRYRHPGKWVIEMRFGAPLPPAMNASANDITAIVERQVIDLSQ